MPHHSTYIAGMKFCPQSAREHFYKLPQGAELKLVSEPDNKFDSNAVQVISGNHHIGYVPAMLAAEVGQMLAARRIEKTIKRFGSQIEIHYRSNP